MYKIEDRLHFVGGFPEDKRAGDVGSVALDFAAIVEHEDAAFVQSLLLARAVRQGGELVDVEAGFALEADALVGCGNEVVHVDGGHAGMKRLRNGAVDKQGRAAGQAQAFDLVRVFDHAASGGDG